MKSAHQEVEVRLNILQGMFYAGCGIGAWCYDDAGKLFMSTAPHGEEYRILLENGGRLLVLLGPAYLHSRSVDESLAKLDRKGLSEAIRRRYMTVLGDVPVLHADMSRHYACMLQFGSRSYFDKVFRREIGISPKQFRDSLGQTERTEVT